jgi:hypothetical protein
LIDPLDLFLSSLLLVQSVNSFFEVLSEGKQSFLIVCNHANLILCMKSCVVCLRILDFAFLSL